MSAITGTMSNEKGISAFIPSHPLVSYFFLAYAGMWLLVAPLVMDAFGLGQLSDVMSLVLFVLSSWSGPTVAVLGDRCAGRKSRDKTSLPPHVSIPGGLAVVCSRTVRYPRCEPLFADLDLPAQRTHGYADHLDWRGACLARICITKITVQIQHPDLQPDRRHVLDIVSPATLLYADRLIAGEYILHWIHSFHPVPLLYMDV